MNALEVRNLNVEIAGVKVLEDVNFEVEKGQVLAIIGPNGAGKTVLLKSLIGLIPYRGEITWRDGSRIGYVPQKMDIETDVPLTVQEFFSLRGPAVSKEKILEALGFVQLKPEMLKKG